MSVTDSPNDPISEPADAMLAGTLAALIQKHGLPIDVEKSARLARYCRLLWDWNERINLTRHLDAETFVTRDLFDTVALSEHLTEGESVLDVGSGGGVPGIPLAILRPDLRISLSESMGKKAQVLNDLVARLRLPITIFAARAEHVLVDHRFDALTIRAVGPMDKILTWFRPHWSSIGRLLLIKGPKWVEERGKSRHHGLMTGLDLRRLKEYSHPETHAISVLLRISPKVNDAGAPAR